MKRAICVCLWPRQMTELLYKLSWYSEFTSNNPGEPWLRISRVLRVHSWHRHMPHSAEVHMSDSHGLKGSGRDKAAVYFGFFLPGCLYVCTVALTPFHHRRTEINNSMRTIFKKPRCGGGWVFLAGLFSDRSTQTCICPTF